MAQGTITAYGSGEGNLRDKMTGNRRHFEDVDVIDAELLRELKSTGAADQPVDYTPSGLDDATSISRSP